jgi:hypothetical protein
LMESTTSSFLRCSATLVHCATSITSAPVRLPRPGVASLRAWLVMSCSSKPCRHMDTELLCRR